ncbi:glucose 1-dehydrogenase [bacterium]|nr:glucose 1-dehydrogenase [bacterium]MBT3903511.1 glucose 1-dehydrogenase [bacterium]MBT4578209.1 glucose 1-dehydrogenase [bacterium]MBT5345446.1 glucose 1-dehydrogenase [bacterium]MBT6131140.1 glucose 1-dehydrogenase [bacterium]
MDRLKGKIALITGAANGIGQAIARIFAREGAIVIIADVDDKQGELLADELGDNATFSHLDVANEQEWQEAMSMLEDKYHQLDVLVNNAGIIGDINNDSSQDPENCPLEVWQKIHAINMDSVFLGCKHAIALMKKNSCGSIINMSSRSGIVGVPHAAAYASSKASIRNHTKSVALYCAQQEYNIRCNSLHPAAIMTDIWNQMLGDNEQREETLQRIASSIPLGHFGVPEDVALAALYLASDDSAYITGAELVIDGGILAGSAASVQKN